MNQLNDNTAQPPHVDSRSVIVDLNVFKHVFMTRFFVLKQNIVQKLGTHVLRRGQFVLF